MPHYKSLTGGDLIMLFIEKGWTVVSERGGHVILSLGDKRIGITEPYVHPLKRVRNLCEANDVKTAEFEQLMMRVSARHGGGVANRSETPSVH